MVLVKARKHPQFRFLEDFYRFVVLPKRWVVERSLAWLEKCRRLWKNCERKLNTSLQMVVLAFAALILNRL